MAELIDSRYYQELAGADPEWLCRNGRCRYLAEDGCYLLHLWGVDLSIDPGRGRVLLPAGHLGMHDYFSLFAIYYLLHAGDVPPRGEWISEKDLAGGATFFRGPHLLPTALISDRFGNSLDLLDQHCRALGGAPLAMADRSWLFTIAADIPLALLYWRGDDEFPAEGKLLYDRSISQLLSLDIVYALAVAACHRLAGG